MRTDRYPGSLVTAAAFLIVAALPFTVGAEGTLHDPREVHLADVTQLTFGGENAEAYWSPDGRQLIFQSTRPPYECDQIFRMSAEKPGEKTLVSTGKGRTTCAYFFYPGGERILYSSTHLAGEACPPQPDFSQGYVWALYDSYEIFTALPDGSDLVRLTDNQAYDAEATMCPKDGTIVFTSTRDGDLELYRMAADGSQVQRLTATPGYDGGAFFSPDCTQIVWRASRPREGKELDDYRRLLGQGLIRPNELELWVANADGSEARQITHLDAASFAPYFHPSGKKIVFSSNYGGSPREFDIWQIGVDGSGLERLTYTEGFDGFPMFSPDGERLVFASNRNQGKPGETDVYVARWIEAPPRKGEEAKAETSAERYREAVAWLSSDLREGRGVGTRGLEEAAAWLEERFAAMGVAGGGNSYRQAFEVVRVRPGECPPAVAGGVAVPADDYQLASSPATGERGDVRTLHNVVARIAGSGHPGGAIVIGAHYDHLGMGGPGSLAPGRHEPHNGADDNASGTAALLEIARALKDKQGKLGRDIYLVAFSGEESGLLGSTRFTREPPGGLEIGDVYAMLNLDMVGRLRNNRLSVLGAESAEEWGDLVSGACARAGVGCELTGGGYGPSDETPFYAAGVPALHFFTGTHGDYHKPSDDAAKINAAGGARIAALVADLAAVLANRDAPLTYKTLPPPEPSR